MAPVLAAARPIEDDLGVASYFEVHVHRDQRWMIDCTSASASEAVAEAEAIVRRTDVKAVKVVNERYNPQTEQTASRVVFKVEKPERKRGRGSMRLAAAPRVSAPAPPVAEPATAPLPPAELSGPLLPLSGRAGPPSAAAPWLLFAWASLALALGASGLFILLLVVG